MTTIERGTRRLRRGISAPLDSGGCDAQIPSGNPSARQTTVTARTRSAASSGLAERESHTAIQIIALHLLESGLDELVAKAVACVQHEVAEYADSPVTRSDLLAHSRRTLALALTRLAGEPISPSIADAASEAGRSRAEQGLVLPALLQAFRIDLRILWEAIIAEGKACGLTTDAAFLDGCVRVWEAVEANTIDVVRAYRSVQLEREECEDVLRREAFNELLTDGERDPVAVLNAAKRLGLAGGSDFLVLVGDGVPSHHTVAGGVTARLSVHGFPSYFHWRGGELVGVVRLGRSTVDDAIPLLSLFERWSIGAHVVADLASVPRGVRLARAVIRCRPEPGIRLLGSTWVAAVASADHELAGAMADSVLAPLLALPEHSREAVFETLRAYVGGDGSVTEVAVQTYRHRNTVRNRLREAEQVTGLSLSRPRDIALLALALEWLDTQARLVAVADHGE